MADPAYIVDGVLTDGEAWVGLNTTTLGSDTATVTFTSTDDGQVGDFSQYMDLFLIIYGRNASADTGADQAHMVLNNVSATGAYSYQYLRGNGSAASAAAADQTTCPVGYFIRNNETANIFCASTIHLFDINSGKYKSVLVQFACEIEDGSGYDYAGLFAATANSQAPITEIDLTLPYGNDWLTGSSFSLFGVLPRMVA